MMEVVAEVNGFAWSGHGSPGSESASSVHLACGAHPIKLGFEYVFMWCLRSLNQAIADAASLSGTLGLSTPRKARFAADSMILFSFVSLPDLGCAS